jgi:hypothetical protein
VDIFVAIPILEYFLVHPYFMLLLHRSISVTTIHQIIIIRVIEFGSQVIGVTGRSLMVREEFGFQATGNGDKIAEDPLSRRKDT